MVGTHGRIALAKIEGMVKGEKVRLTHDMRRNGPNEKVAFQERLVLPRVKDIEGRSHDAAGDQGQP